MTYSETYATCGVCPLRDKRWGGPVDPYLGADLLATLLGEAPGTDEVEGGAPFLGSSGQLLWAVLKQLGYARSNFFVTNVLSCRPPGNSLSGKWVPEAIMACSTRLWAEIQAADLPVIALGGTAWRTISGQETKISKARGIPVTLSSGRLCVPTYHPAAVLRQRSLLPIFVSDLARAMRLFTSGTTWREPTARFAPSPEQLVSFLSEDSPYWVCDGEWFPTYPQWRIFDHLQDPLGLLGIAEASGTSSVIIPFLSRETPPRSWYTKSQLRDIVDIVKEFLSSNSWLKVGHNFGDADKKVLEHTFKVRVAPIEDTILYHKFVYPEYRHTLAFAGSMDTDVHDWKAEHLATEAKTDREWMEYNNIDLGVTAQIYSVLKARVEERDQVECVKFNHRLQDACVELHRAGMYVDQAERRRWDVKLLTEALAARRVCQDVAGKSFNPGSVKQLKDLLFSRWGLLPVSYNEKTGEPSTNDYSLCTMLLDYQLQPHQRDLITSLRTYRECIKWRGTYTLKYRIIGEDAINPEEACELEIDNRDVEWVVTHDPKLPGRTDPDGRIRSSYSSHAVLGWRFSSSGATNAQNVPKALRSMIIARPGNALVACDMAQLELRMVAALANDEAYLEAFASGADPHGASCLAFFGKMFEAATPEMRVRLRVASKTHTFQSLYGGGAKGRLRIIRFEEQRGQFPNREYDLKTIVSMDRKWHALHPAIRRWWNSLTEEYRRLGYLREPVLGMRCDFLDGPELPKLSNFKAQAGGAALTHKAMFRFLERYPFRCWGPGTGLIGQKHDDLLVECPAEHIGPQVVERDSEGNITKTKWCRDDDCKCTPNTVSKYLEECMCIDGREYGLPVTFKGEAKIGNRWSEV